MFSFFIKIALFMSHIFFRNLTTNVELYPHFNGFRILHSNSKSYLLDYFYNIYATGNISNLKDMFFLTKDSESIRGILKHTKMIIREVFECITPGDFIHLQSILLILSMPQLIYFNSTLSKDSWAFNMDTKNELTTFYEGSFIIPSNEYYNILTNLKLLNSEGATQPLYDDYLYISYDNVNKERYSNFSFYFRIYLQNVKILGSKKVPNHLKEYISLDYEGSLTKSQIEYIKKMYVPKVEIEIVQYTIYDESKPYIIFREETQHFKNIKTLL
jgi:hypothetical protein